MRDAPTLLWFRLDLRLGDNPALQAAVKRGGPVIPVFIWSPEEEAPWEPGAASRWWLRQSLKALESDLLNAGSRLVIRRGPTLQAIRSLIDETRAEAVFWNRRYEPRLIARDSAVQAALRASGVEVDSFNAALLNEPWTIQNQAGKPFQVFTPFWRKCLAQTEPLTPQRAPGRFIQPSSWPKSIPLDSLSLEPGADWTEGLREAWRPGEAGAGDQLRRFVSGPLPQYNVERDRPDLPGVSRLSPHLHFGEIGPRQIWHTVRLHAEERRIPEGTWHAWSFLTELGWREFAHHLLWHFPHTPDQPLRAEFARFPWRNDAAMLKAWQRGKTGYPIVDAGMRELWRTGWMHNRVRMITASFLIKDLLISWRDGARWFWDTLVDADLAQNTLGWQWTAGCGADAAPFFRIFNPVSQGRKFDPHGAYVSKWIPSLARLPVKWVHAPWDAPVGALASAEVELGQRYPERIVSHVIAREVALEAVARMKSGRNTD